MTPPGVPASPLRPTDIMHTDASASGEGQNDVAIGEFIARWDDAADGVCMDANDAQMLARELKRLRRLLGETEMTVVSTPHVSKPHTTVFYDDIDTPPYAGAPMRPANVVRKHFDGDPPELERVVRMVDWTQRDTLRAMREVEVQAMGAALSTRNWTSMEDAYNQLRDKMDRILCARPL